MGKLILVVDDESSVREALTDILTDSGYRVECSASGGEGLEKIETLNPDVVLLDVRMPDIDGIKVLELVRRRGERTPIILITAYGSTQTTIEAMKLGAFDYLMKPLKIGDLLEAVKKAIEVKELIERARTGETTAESDADTMIGLSPGMQNVYKVIGRVANTNATVLIRGESGTGKELLAHALHMGSPRRSGPFIKVNCAAVPENLLESELFGYQEGAFTGAKKGGQIGKFEQANGGTIFLDEIGDMPLIMQAKLLRVLQEKEIERLGDNKPRQVDVRVVAATNSDLEEAIKEGRFRDDLYYRLNVVSLYLPPMRERIDDLRPLTAHFIDKFNREFGLSVCDLAPEVWELFCNYPWPGNVRELENIIERAFNLVEGPVISVANLPLYFQKYGKSKRLVAHKTLPALLEQVEKEAIQEALEATGGNKMQAAKALGISRAWLYKKMKQYGIKP
ncbi:MAG: sigma-54 dependent transcriptional regulator [Firmicutes bacterium]|nr:sigma-54 dependent transcriptional regulator [Bacillota bacterium]